MSRIQEVNHYYKNMFDSISMKCLLKGYNICAPDWGETDCIYGYYKFYYFQAGDATIIINGDTYHPKPGELFMIPANTKHTYMHNPSNPVLKYWCHFDVTFSEGQKITYSKEIIKCIPPMEVVTSLFVRLMNLEISNLLDILTEKAILIELFKIFLEHIDYHKLLSQNFNSYTTKLNDYILQNLQSDIKLKDLADIVHLHPNYFIPYFKRYFLVTPMEYVNAVRLERATQLLIHEPGLNIDQVAFKVGFNDYRYFSRTFKKRYGLTPSAYKGLQTGGIC